MVEGRQRRHGAENVSLGAESVNTPTVLRAALSEQVQRNQEVQSLEQFDITVGCHGRAMARPETRA